MAPCTGNENVSFSENVAAQFKNNCCWRCILAIALLFTIIVNWYYFQGFIASDDNRYFMAAHRLISGTTLATPSSIIYDGGAPRLGIVGFVASVLYLTNHKILAVSLCFVGFHLVLVLQAAWLGSRFYGRDYGLWASLLTAMSPMICYVAGVVLPDLPLTVVSNFALICLLKTGPGQKIDGIGRWRWPFIAGILIALSASFNIIGLIMMVPAMATIYLQQRESGFLKHVTFQGALFCGFSLVVVFYYLAMLAITGQMFSELTLISKWTGGDYPHGLWPNERLSFAFQAMKSIMPISVFAFFACMLLYFMTPKVNLILLIWVLWPILYLTFGSARIDLYVPAPIAPRHYILAVVPGAVMGARVVWHAILFIIGKFAALPRWAPWVIAGLLIGAWTTVEMEYNKEIASNYSKRKLVNAFLEAHYLARNLYPNLPMVLSHEVSDRLSALFIKDKRSDLYINNATFKGFRDGVPERPFIFITWSHFNRLSDFNDRELLKGINLKESDRVRAIAPPYIYSYDLWQGNLFGHFNPSTPFTPKSSFSPVNIFLVE